MSDLPLNWTITQLGSVAEFIMGQAPPSAECNFEGKGIPFVKAGEFSEQRPIIREWTTKPLKQAFYTDVLVCVVGATSGKLNLGADCAIGRSVAAIRPKSNTFAEFLYYQLQPKVEELRRASTGSAQGVISKDMLDNIPINLPPLAEQRRIVARLDALFARSRRARVELERVPRLVERARQAVLAMAFSGELTREWREAREIPKPSLEDLGKVVSDIRYGTAQKCFPEPKGVAVLRIPNVASGQIDLTDLKYADLNNRELSKLRLEEGDILVVRSNGSADLVGRPALVSVSAVGLAYAGYLIRIRPNHSTVFSPFLALMLEAPQIRQIVEVGARSTSGVHNINSAELASLRVPMFALAEQAEIARRIEAAFARIDRMAAESARATALLDRLEQATLAKAFRGELLPAEFSMAAAEGT